MRSLFHHCFVFVVVAVVVVAVVVVVVVLEGWGGDEYILHVLLNSSDRDTKAVS